MSLPYRMPAGHRIDAPSSDPTETLAAVFDAYVPSHIDEEVSALCRSYALKGPAALVRETLLSPGQWQLWLGLKFTQSAYDGGLEGFVDMHPLLVLDLRDLLATLQMTDFLSLYTTAAAPFIAHLDAVVGTGLNFDNAVDMAPVWKGFEAIWERVPDHQFAEIDHHFMRLEDGSSRDGLLPINSYATALERNLIAMSAKTPDDFCE